MDRIFLALMALALLTAPQPAELVWHPVEQLVGSFEKVQLLTTMNKKTQAKVIVVTGLVPINRQIATVEETLQISTAQASSLVEVIDFTIERQELDIGAKVPPDSPVWKTLSLDDAKSVLEKSESDQAEVVPTAQTDPVVTMPLPRVVGTWPKCVAHPKLTADHRLFRFIDFTAQPGHHYRYRVRLELRNPKFEDSPDPFISAGATRLSPWSLPSPTVTFSP